MTNQRNNKTTKQQQKQQNISTSLHNRTTAYILLHGNVLLSPPTHEKGNLDVDEAAGRVGHKLRHNTIKDILYTSMLDTAIGTHVVLIHSLEPVTKSHARDECQSKGSAEREKGKNVKSNKDKETMIKPTKSKVLTNQHHREYDKRSGY